MKKQQNIQKKTSLEAHRTILLIGVMIMFIVFSCGFTYATEWDNVKTYDVDTSTVTIKNSILWVIPLSTITTATLDTPLDYKVGIGYNKVAQTTFNPEQDYNDLFGEFDLIDLRTGKEIKRQIDIKYLTTELVDENIYDNECSFLKNGTEYCDKIVIGTKKVEKEVWVDFDNTIKTDEKVIIGLFTDVQVNDKVEWIPTIAGVKVREWATWTADLNVGLVSYYKLDETGTGLVIDSAGTNPGTNFGATRGATGKLGNAFDFENTISEYVDLNNSFVFNKGHQMNIKQIVALLIGFVLIIIPDPATTAAGAILVLLAFGIK